MEKKRETVELDAGEMRILLAQLAELIAGLQRLEVQLRRAEKGR